LVLMGDIVTQVAVVCWVARFGVLGVNVGKSKTYLLFGIPVLCRGWSLYVVSRCF